MQVVFSHGKESGPWGGKISALAEVARHAGCQVASPDYRGMDDPSARVDKLLSQLSGLREPPVLAGSSMGGHVAAAAAARVPVRGLFLMAPAFYMPGYESLTPPPPSCPVTIVHGWRDEIVPVDNALRFARACTATVHLLPGDHRLLDQLDTLRALFGLFLDGLSRQAAAPAH